MEMQLITAEELRARLQQGKVNFAFTKTNQVTLRMANGTLNLDYIPRIAEPNGKRQSPPTVIPFYDFDKNGWRCVSVSSKIYVL